MRGPAPYRFNTKFYASQLRHDLADAARTLARRVEMVSGAIQELGPFAMELARRLRESRGKVEGS